MPRKKIVKKVVQKRKKTVIRKPTSQYFKNLQDFKWTESYSSFLLGVVVVIVIVLFGVSIIRQQHQAQQQTSSLQIGPTGTPSVTASPTPGTTITESGKSYYIVKPNDSLWSIAVAVYNNGYKWTEIATANNLANPGTIFTGDKLVLPNAPTPSELGQMMQQNNPEQPDAIVGKTYTVQRDDNLWTIAVRAYGDGYQWTKIANANNLATPDLIFSGNVLQLPR